MIRADRTFAFALLAALAILACPAVAQTGAGRIVVPSPGGFSAGLPLPPLLGAPVVRQRTIAEDIARDRQRRRALDASRIDPQVPSPGRAISGAGRAYEGRSTLDRARAGDFARSGPAAIGASPVTRLPGGSRR